MLTSFNRPFSFLLILCLLAVLFPVHDVQAASAPFLPGEYYIVSALDENKVLDIHCMSRDNGANAQIYQLNNCGAQIFSISWSGGWATIVNTHSGKALDVQSGATHAGANVWQYEKNGTDAQKWNIVSAGDGWYYIKAKCGKALDVSGGASANNTNVQIWDPNGTAAQKWRFVPVSQVIPDDTYYIFSAVGSGDKVLDIQSGFSWNKANVQIYKHNRSHAQRFKVSRLQNGYYTIRNEGSRKYLDIAGGGRQAGTNVWQYEKNGTDAQQWYFMPCDDGWYYIIGKNGLYLDVSNGRDKNGTNVQVWTGAQTYAQKFKLVPLVNYRYVTLTYDCSSFEKWIQSAKQDPVGLSTNPGVVIGQQVLEYRTIRVWNPQSRKYMDLKAPRRVQFKIHYHEYVQGFGRSWIFGNNSIITRQSCDCGFSKSGAVWEIPDLTEMSGSQTTSTVISTLPQIN